MHFSCNHKIELSVWDIQTGIPLSHGYLAMTIILMMLEMHFWHFQALLKNKACHEYYWKINSSLYRKLIPISWKFVIKWYKPIECLRRSALKSRYQFDQLPSPIPTTVPGPLLSSSKSLPWGQLFSAKLWLLGRKGETKSPLLGIICSIRMTRHQ